MFNLSKLWGSLQTCPSDSTMFDAAAKKNQEEKKRKEEEDRQDE